MVNDDSWALSRPGPHGPGAATVYLSDDFPRATALSTKDTKGTKVELRGDCPRAATD